MSGACRLTRVVAAVMRHGHERLNVLKGATWSSREMRCIHHGRRCESGLWLRLEVNVSERDEREMNKGE